MTEIDSPTTDRASRVEVERCLITGNPVGTDTWAHGFQCPCKFCQHYIDGHPLWSLSDIPNELYPFAKSIIRLEILTGRMRAVHEETGKHELLAEAEAFCSEGRSEVAAALRRLTPSPVALDGLEEPTSRGDRIADELRTWYEANRESWWDRRREIWRIASDEFMLGLINELHRIEQEPRR